MSDSPVFRSPRIGEILVSHGKLTKSQAGEAAKVSVQQDVLFGEAAVALGYVSRADVEQSLAAKVPLPTQFPGQPKRPLVVWHRPQSPEAEHYRGLRSTLTLRWFHGNPPHRALSLISSDIYDGTSTVAANLAMSFALAGAQTLLVDANLRNPKQHHLFGLSNKTGLANILDQGQFTIPHYGITGIENLTIMVAGSTSINPQELLLRSNFVEYMNIQTSRYDVVLVDTAAASFGNDYQVPARTTGGALLVTRAARTRVRPTIGLLNACDDIGVSIVGATMVNSARETRSIFSKIRPNGRL